MSKVKAGKTVESTDKKMTAKEMVNEALTQLNDRSGSSFSAIRKFIAEKHPNVDLDRYNSNMKKYIKSAVENGLIKKTSGGLNTIQGEF